MKSEDKFPSFRDFYALLDKPDNKIRLQFCLQTAFQRTTASTDTEIIYCVVGSPAKNLSTDQPMPNLSCFHAEGDTALFTIYDQLLSASYSTAVVLDTEYIDNYV